MPNTKPVCSSAEIAHAVEAEAARVGLCDANQTVSITKDFDGKTLDHLMTLPEDVKFITEDGNGVMNNAVMARAVWRKTLRPCATAIWPNTTAPGCTCAMFPPRSP